MAVKKGSTETKNKTAAKKTAKGKAKSRTAAPGGTKKARGTKAASTKTSLPAFGLAEDILGKQAAGTASEPAERNRREEISEGQDQRTFDGDGAAQEAGPQLHLVTFNLDREEYGVDIDRVQEIIRVGAITPVPNAPEFIRGVINLRGRVIPVLELRRRLDIAEGQLTKNSRIMVVESKAKVLGMLVDAVSQVLWLPVSAVESPPEEVERTRTYVRGIGKVESRLIMLMDLDRVLEKEMPATVV